MIGQPLRKLLICAGCLFLGAGATHAAGEPTADPVAAAIGSSERPAERSEPGRQAAAGRFSRLLRREAGLARRRHVLRRRLLHRTAVAHRGSQGRGDRLQQPGVCGFLGQGDRRALRRQPSVQRRAAHRRGRMRSRSSRTVSTPRCSSCGITICTGVQRTEAGPRPTRADALQAARGAQGRRCGDRAGSRRQSRRRHPRSSNKLHRIDPAVVLRDFEEAGFKFDGESARAQHEATITPSSCSTRDPRQDRPGHLPVPQGCPLTATACCDSRCGRDRAMSRPR